MRDSANRMRSSSRRKKARENYFDVNSMSNAQQEVNMTQDDIEKLHINFSL